MLLIENIRELVVICNQKQRYLLSKDIKTDFVVMKDMSLIIGDDGNILEIASSHDTSIKYPTNHFSSVIDASGKCIIPGLVDAHTHTVWAGDRVHEFAMKLKGASYMEIHAAGGGIGFTVEKTHQASKEELLESLLVRLNKSQIKPNK